LCLPNYTKLKSIIQQFLEKTGQNFVKIFQQTGKKWRGFRSTNPWKFFAREPSGSVLSAVAGGGPLVISDFASWICGSDSAK